MPVVGLPMILDSTINTLIQRSTLSSFKIFSNEDGSSSVIINFADINHLAQPFSSYPPRQFSPYPPRPQYKSPSKVKRDKERKDEYYRQNNTPMRQQSKRPCQERPSPPTSPSSGDVCRPVQVASTKETKNLLHTTHSNHSPVSCNLQREPVESLTSRSTPEVPQVDLPQAFHSYFAPECDDAVSNSSQQTSEIDNSGIADCPITFSGAFSETAVRQKDSMNSINDSKHS